MIYLPNGIKETLQENFKLNGLFLDIKNNHVIVKKSSKETKEKIEKIIESSGFCPLVSQNKINENFVFTIVPYNLPGFFISSSKGNSQEIENHRSFCKFEELSHLLENAIFVSKKEKNEPEDKYSEINAFRSFVSLALNKGLSEIISKHSIDDRPIIEIGSGIGYALSESLSKKTIRTQRSTQECQLLQKSSTNPIYQLNIESLGNKLKESGKRVSLFFAINVFDYMFGKERKESLSKLSLSQDSGDKILVISDVNPALGATIDQLESLHPHHVALPYFSLKNSYSKLSFVLVPEKLYPFKPSEDLLSKMIEEDSMALLHGFVTKTQKYLHKLQGKYDLKIIELETFISEQIKVDLEEAGYETKIYYHTSFSVGEVPKNINVIQQDMLYKSVTASSSVRQWSLNDPNLKMWLEGKGLSLPDNYDENFLIEMRKQNKKILGAEFLVIEATKK